MPRKTVLEMTESSSSSGPRRRVDDDGNNNNEQDNNDNNNKNSSNNSKRPKLMMMMMMMMMEDDDPSTMAATMTTNATPRDDDDDADRSSPREDVADDADKFRLWTDIPDPATRACITVDPSNVLSSMSHHQNQQPQPQQPEVVVRLDSTNDNDESRSSSLLQDLLHPLDAPTFLWRCWGRCAVHVRQQAGGGGAGGGDHHRTTNNEKNGDGADSTPQQQQQQRTAAPTTQTRFSQLVSDHLFDLDPRSILRATASDNVFVWLQPTAAAPNHNNTTGPLIHSLEIPDADDAYQLHVSGGHATYCRAPPALEHLLVSSLLRDTGLLRQNGSSNNANSNSASSLGARGEVEVFMSSPLSSSPSSSSSNATTGWHYDFQENFTLQLSGRKRWTLQKGTVQHPLQRGCTPHYHAPGAVESQLLAARLADPHFQFDVPKVGVNAVGEPQTVTLEPGDVLYFPAGMWHTVEALEAGAVSINVSLIPTNYASLTAQAVQHVLARRPEWRQPVRHLPGGSRLSVVEQLQGLLRDLPGIIREFEASGGAQAMVPPVLYHSNNNTAAAAQSSIMDDMEEDDDDDDVDESDETTEPLIRVSDFEHHPSPPFNTARRHCRLVRNPLALLLSEPHEIQRFYRGNNGGEEKSDTATNDDHKKKKNTEQGNGGESGDSDNKNKDNKEEVFVLNVSYAGNEAHESLVRVRLSADPRQVEALERALDDNSDDATNDDCNSSSLSSSWAEFYERHRNLVDCLHFYGYLLWKESR